MFEKALSREALPNQIGIDLFTLAARSYPRSYAGRDVEAYGIPILEDFHEALFP